MEPTPQLGSEEKAMEGSHGPGHTQLSRWKPLELDAHRLWLSSPLVCNINFESGATQDISLRNIIPLYILRLIPAATLFDFNYRTENHPTVRMNLST